MQPEQIRHAVFFALIPQGERDTHVVIIIIFFL